MTTFSVSGTETVLDSHTGKGIIELGIDMGSDKGSDMIPCRWEPNQERDTYSRSGLGSMCWHGCGHRLGKGLRHGHSLDWLGA